MTSLEQAPYAIPTDAVGPFNVGDRVTVASPVEGETETYSAIVSAVAPMRNYIDGPIVWLIDLYSTTWLPQRLRQAAYDEAGVPDPSRATLTFVAAGEYPPGINAATAAQEGTE